MTRDFTYIDDISNGVVKVFDKPAMPSHEFNPRVPDPASSTAPFRVFNIGNGKPTPLMSFIAELEGAFGKKAIINMLPMQLGDVQATSADIQSIENWIGFRPQTDVHDGVLKFADWFFSFYSDKKKVC